jgi:hypothetical protein
MCRRELNKVTRRDLVMHDGGHRSQRGVGHQRYPKCSLYKTEHRIAGHVVENERVIGVMLVLVRRAQRFVG